jgi:integrase
MSHLQLNSTSGWRRNMRIRLKGLNWVKATLADGRSVTRWYAWRGGPRLRGEPGSPEFIASYNDAVACKIAAPTAGTLKSVLAAYEADEEAFGSLAERTKADYIGKLRLIEKSFGNFPLGALPDRRTRGVFKSWRNELAKRSKRQADYAWTVLARVLAWALENGLVDANPCTKGGRLYHGSRVDKVWSFEAETGFLATAPKHLHLPFLLAIWTAQRQGDLLRLPWSAYDGSYIRLRQSKTGKSVTIPAGAPLKRALDAARAARGAATTILCNSDGMPWTGDGFRSSWRKVCKKAGVTGLTFHDLRGSAITRLAVAGATVPEISKISGLSLGDVRGILDKHYLADDTALADNAIRKLEDRSNRS